MAQKFYLYQTDAWGYLTDKLAGHNTKKYLAITADDGLMALYPDIVRYQNDITDTARSAPTAYDTLEDLLVDQPAAVQNSRIQPRGVDIEVPGFGTAFLPILNNELNDSSGAITGNDWATTVNHWQTDTDDDDAAVITEGELSVAIIGFRGEQRSMIAP